MTDWISDTLAAHKIGTTSGGSDVTCRCDRKWRSRDEYTAHLNYELSKACAVAPEPDEDTSAASVNAMTLERLRERLRATLQREIATIDLLAQVESANVDGPTVSLKGS